MTPVTYVVEFDNCFYGPFASIEDAAKWAGDRGYTPFGVMELKTP